jgi:lipopolysaccharide/colanic/teichoic acid biosynthesis glycosyltransferase
MTSKRLFDLLFVIPSLLFVLPFFVLFAVWIMLDSTGPVFFRQERIGRKGRPFSIWKFRTMIDHAEKDGSQLTIGDDPRITRSGYWLRKFKIDELPQLFNVLMGDMSLVGPRPEVPRYVSLYTVEQRRILDQIPGITDPASIRYRDENRLLSQSSNAEKTYRDDIMPEKIKINLEYTANATLWSDIKVILKTITVCFG